MKTSKRVITVRLSMDEIKCIDEICMRANKTRSEALREMLLRARRSTNEEKSHEMVRYIGNLLTALIRKISRTDPQEAEAIIRKAYLAAREGRDIWQD